MNPPKQLMTIGLLGLTGVSLGAFAAHSLKNQLPSGLINLDQLNGFDTGVRYQIYHALAMLLIIILKKDYDNKFLNWAYNFFFVGILLFSGSLYFLCTRHLLNADWLKFLGPITPIGGLFLISGWACLSFSAIKKK